MAFYCQQEAFELLESNLENLSNELDGLLLSSETHYDGYDSASGGASAVSYLCNNAIMPPVDLQPNVPYRRITKQVSVAIETCLGVQPPTGVQNVLPNVQPFSGGQQASHVQALSCVQQPTFMQPLCGLQKPTSSGIQQASNLPCFAGTPKKLLSGSGAGGSATTQAPVCEFYYLRSQSSNYQQCSPMVNKQLPLISTCFAKDYACGNSFNGNVGNGAIRKYSNQRYNKKSINVTTEQIDYDKVVVNMEELGLSNEIVERNAVMRLMNLFYLLNYYLNDVIPYGRSVGDETVDPKSIPHTMSLQNQVKNAIRNCTIFMCDKERILNAHKLNDPILYSECERSLNIMRRLCLQLDIYKRVDLDHKKCHFLTEYGRENGQRLELLLEQLNDQVRECNIFIHVFDWSMKAKQAGLEYESWPILDDANDVYSEYCRDNYDVADGASGGSNTIANQSIPPEGKETPPTNTQPINRYIG